MRRLWLIVTIPLTVALAIFALANREPVQISLWPLDLTLDLPLFLLALGTFAIGLLLGAFLIWLPLLRWRHRARAEERRARRLEAELAAARALPPERVRDAAPPPRAIAGR
jgi:putative membrane protein